MFVLALAEIRKHISNECFISNIRIQIIILILCFTQKSLPFAESSHVCQKPHLSISFISYQ